MGERKNTQHAKEMNGIKLWKWLHYVTRRVNLLRNRLVATVLMRAQLGLNRSEKSDYRLQVKHVRLAKCNSGKCGSRPFSCRCQLIHSRCMKYPTFLRELICSREKAQTRMLYNFSSTRVSMELRLLNQRKSNGKFSSQFTEQTVFIFIIRQFNLSAFFRFRSANSEETFCLYNFHFY